MRFPTAWQVKDLTFTTGGIFVLYLFAYFLVFAAITPLQERVMPEITQFASLLFLPHGIRVLGTSLLGVRAVPGLVLAELTGNYLFWGMTQPDTLLFSALISGSITWIVFEGLRSLRVNAFYLQLSEQAPAFPALLLAGLLASAANAFLLTSLIEGNMGVGHVTMLIAAYMTGDVTGLFAVLLAVRYVMPAVTRLFGSP